MSESTLAPVSEEEAHERLEAEFLRAEASFGAWHPEPLLPDAEIAVGDRPGPRPRVTRMPTRGTGCCK
jgi:hypothetical protein